METNNPFNASKIIEKINNGLKKAQQEMEELALQFTLGKVEAADIFEDVKKEFNGKAHEWKQRYESMKVVSLDRITALKVKFEELQVQLALGRADAKDLFEKQQEKILHAINEMETEIKSNPELQEHFEDFKTEMEKFKLKLEILKLKYELKKFEVKGDFKNEMTEARIKIDKIVEKMEGKWDGAKVKYADFGDEIDLAYKHLKKAVGKL